METYKIIAVISALVIMAVGSLSSLFGTDPPEVRRQRQVNTYLASITVLMFALVMSV